MSDQLLNDLPDVPDDSSPDDVVEPGDAPETQVEGDKPGRTLEQVKGEFDRKFSKLQGQIEVVLERLSTQTIATAPSNTPDNSIDSYSLSQLKSAFASLPDDNPQKSQLGEVIRQKEIKEGVNAGISEFRQTMEFKEARGQANETAVRRYPQLKNQDSEFYVEVKRRLRNLGQSFSNKNPRAVLDIANEVAIDTGVSPRTKVKGVRGTTATRRSSSSAPDTEVTDTPMTTERAKTIANKLKGALPKGKEFNIEQVKKHHKVYLDNIDLLTRG